MSDEAKRYMTIHSNEIPKSELKLSMGEETPELLVRDQRIAIIGDPSKLGYREMIEKAAKLGIDISFHTEDEWRKEQAERRRQEVDLPEHFSLRDVMKAEAAKVRERLKGDIKRHRGSNRAQRRSGKFYDV